MIFFSKHYNAHHYFGGENMQLVQPDLFSFAVDFFFLLNLMFGSSVTLQARVSGIVPRR